MKKFIFSIVLIISSFMIYNQNVNAQSVDFSVRTSPYSYAGTEQTEVGITFGSRTFSDFNTKGFFTTNGTPFHSGRLSLSLNSSFNGTKSINFILGLESSSGINEAINMSTITANNSACSVNLITKANNGNWGLSAVSCPYVDFNGSILNVSFATNNALTITISNVNIFNLASGGGTSTDYTSNLTQIVTQINFQGQRIVDAVDAQSIMLRDILRGFDIQTIIDNQDTANQNIEDIKNDIKDSNIDTSSASSSASSWDNKNASNGVITQLLTLPINLLTAIVNGIQTSCSNFSLGTLFNSEIVLPCINISTYIGNGLFTTIDLLISGFMIYNISKKLIKIFNDFTNLKSNQIDEIYGGGN